MTLVEKKPRAFYGAARSVNTWVRGWDLKTRVPYMSAGLLISVPCFWQPHIQADDLSSHLYNAWLVNQAEAGQLKGLYVVPQLTNVLFDHLLSILLKIGGVVFAERAAVLIAVQIFFWGCFAAVSAYARSGVWRITPFLALLTYGAVFRMGFFNFYISVGICVFAIALAWRNQPRAWMLATPLLGLAYLAHSLPCLWALGVIGYLVVARRLRPSNRPWLAAVGLIGLADLAWFVAKRVVSLWPPGPRIDSFLGADQALTYGMKYKFVAAGLLCLWSLLLIRRFEGKLLIQDTMFQLWALGSTACVLMPMSIWLPLYRGGLTYITIRLSLLSAILLLAVIARVRYSRLEIIASIVLVGIFFSFSYVDERAINAVEGELRKAVSSLPPGTRVVATLKDSRLYVPALEHLLDRECIGHCFDFGDYEPATTQFRLRAAPGNSTVMTDIDDISQLEHGNYVWSRQDIELVRLLPCEDGRRVCTTRVNIGERLAKKQITSVPKWLSIDGLPTFGITE